MSRLGYLFEKRRKVEAPKLFVINFKPVHGINTPYQSMHVRNQNLSVMVTGQIRLGPGY